MPGKHRKGAAMKKLWIFLAMASMGIALGLTITLEERAAATVPPIPGTNIVPPDEEVQVEEERFVFLTTLAIVLLALAGPIFTILFVKHSDNK